jgi:methionyl-tRNA formyltransferase
VRLVFLGSGAFAVPSLEAVVDAGHEVALVVTQPDKEKGRGLALGAPPVKPVALTRGLHVLQPRRVREPEAVAALREAAPDAQVVVAYGQILPRAALDVPRLGTVNVHSSLLPKYRGAAPIQWAIAEGEAETGVSTMLLDEGLDTGPVLLERATPIGAEETAPALEQRLARMGAELLVETLEGLAQGRLTPRPQDHARATHARILTKQDGRVDFTQRAEVIDRRVRAFQPWPGAVTTYAGKDLKIVRARVEPGLADAPPGTVVAVDRAGILVAAGGGTGLRLLEVQPESRRAMAASAFAAGARLAAGARFG